jgi:glutamate 5-kinase
VFMKFRKELTGVQRIVVKVGSNVITRTDGKCDLRRLRIIVEDICDLIEKGYEVVLVSSGAINVGKAFLEKYLPNRIELQQSASAIGQPKLINKYSGLFEENGRICSQILLTHEDFKNRNRFLNAKKTIEVLLQNKVIPILNENDTISFSDISVGDNDHLAAQAAQMVNADLLLIVTSAHGLYDKDPEDKTAKIIKYVEFDNNLDGVSMNSISPSGRGGMKSKIAAIKKATEVGVRCLISSKDNERIILDPLSQDLGTYFAVNDNSHSDRKAWLISTKRQNCCIDVDRVTYEALIEKQPLLSNGIVETVGSFYKGDCVDLRYNGKTFAIGVCEFDREEVESFKTMDPCEVILKMNLVINEGVSDGVTGKKV